MTNSGIIIPTEIGKIINERVALWQRFDQAQSQFGEIEKLAPQFSSATPAQLSLPLSTDGTPPSEVAIALQNIQGELAQINKGREVINAYQAEIKRLEKQRLIIIVVVVLVLVAILIAVLFGGFAIISSIFS